MTDKPFLPAKCREHGARRQKLYQHFIDGTLNDERATFDCGCEAFLMRLAEGNWTLHENVHLPGMFVPFPSRAMKP